MSFQSYMIIGQIVLMPSSSTRLSWSGLIPCDGRELKVDEYPELFYIIGRYYGSRLESDNWENEEVVKWFNIPKLESPLQGYDYYICTRGEFPQRD